jgi:hypothetical protein
MIGFLQPPQHHFVPPLRTGEPGQLPLGLNLWPAEANGLLPEAIRNWAGKHYFPLHPPQKSQIWGGAADAQGPDRAQMPLVAIQEQPHRLFSR